MVMNIYFSGIGGVGLGPLAEIALDAGHRVCGSDPTESDMTSQLAQRGVKISHDQTGVFFESQHSDQPIDWFVHTSALPSNHPEINAARDLGIKVSKRDELLAAIIKEKNLKLIAVAGTHGKTTTTGMFVWALKQLAIPVSYSVGTTFTFGPSGRLDPDSEYFVYECDEYDRNFLHYHPHLSLITSIDYDHPDTYPTKDDYLAAFRQFIQQSDGLILWQTDAEKIGIDMPSAWCLQDDEIADVQLAGAHNRRNATLVLKSLERLDLGDIQANRDAINSFPGTDRRFEKLADNLYIDYGHHPIEISATLAMARELSDDIVLVYQPHQNIRQHEIKDQYTDCFSDASDIYWLPTYQTREDPSLRILTPQELTKNITNKEAVHIAVLDTKLWQDIESARKRGALVLLMGAGSIDNWAHMQLKKSER